MSSLFVFAEIHPEPEHYDKARDAILGIIAPTRKEPGCLAFNLFENEEQNTLFLFEEWRGQVDLDAHYETPYTAAVFAEYGSWLQNAPIIRKMTRRA